MPPSPLWKRATKIIAAIVALFVPVLLAAYEAEVIMSHVILPAFSNKEHAVASSILIGVVAALSVAVVLLIVRRVKESARREAREETRGLWDERLLHLFERLGNRFERSHGEDGKTELHDALRHNTTELLGRWYNLVINETQKQEVRLAAATLNCYLSELVRLKQPFTRSTLLLANFEIYAFCVQAILKELIAFKPAAQGTVYVSTILTMDLSRWYNLTTEADGHGRLCAFTRGRWELYRTQASRLKTDPYDPEHWIQGRRILTGLDRLEVGLNLYLCARADGKPHTVAEANTVRLPPCLQLIEEVKNTLEKNAPQEQVYLIAQHYETESPCANNHKRWKRLREEHFEPTYHNATHCKEHPVYVEQKGMFCAYVKQPYPVPQYEDLLLVDLTAVGEGRFGIGYHKDQHGERNGIVFFGDAEVAAHLQYLNGYWDLAAKP
jgi:hypothetical protein